MQSLILDYRAATAHWLELTRKYSHVTPVPAEMHDAIRRRINAAFALADAVEASDARE